MVHCVVKIDCLTKHSAIADIRSILLSSCFKSVKVVSRFWIYEECWIHG